VNEPHLDALIQRAKACRHRAECIERDGAFLTGDERDLISEIARRWRGIAEQLSALAADQELEKAS
jgi:hypothetical protein